MFMVGVEVSVVRESRRRVERGRRDRVSDFILAAPLPR
jgi:hypothetical protein